MFADCITLNSTTMIEILFRLVQCKVTHAVVCQALCLVTQRCGADCAVRDMVVQLNSWLVIVWFLLGLLCNMPVEVISRYYFCPDMIFSTASEASYITVQNNFSHC